MIAEPAVADRWGDESALAGLTVGGVVAHLYAGLRRFEVALDERLPASPVIVGLPDFYSANRVADPADLDTGWHPLLREDAEKRAAHGPGAVAQRFREVLSRLVARLPGESSERLVPVWTVERGVTALPVYAATRVVELVVHSDDLAASADLPPLRIPPNAASAAIDVFVDMARHRSGDVEVIRAFARRERASADVLRVL